VYAHTTGFTGYTLMATKFNKSHMGRQALKTFDMLCVGMLREASTLPDDNNIYRVSMGELPYINGEASTLPDDKNIYRVSMGELPRINVMCLGDGFVDSLCDGEYYGVDALPDWVKERIAILMLCHTEPPMPTIDGVGRRISENIFWVFAPTTKVRDSLTKQESEDE
jgi:hypothetical protein